MHSLREKLLAEEEQYIEEMAAMEETIEGRQQKMKMRAQYLKDKRESERLTYVEDKMDQKFRYAQHFFMVIPRCQYLNIIKMFSIKHTIPQT